MEELKELFKKLGYTESEFEDIVNGFGVVGLKPETLLKKVKENYDFFISLGYTQEEILKMTKILPDIYSRNIDTLKQKIKTMQEIGYTKEEIIKMTANFSPIYSLSIDSIKQRMQDMQALY